MQDATAPRLFARSLSGARRDPLLLWSVAGTFGGTAARYASEVRKTSKRVRCNQILDPIPRLQLPPFTILELERAGRIKQLEQTKGSGRLLFGARGALSSGATLDAGTYQVLFALPGTGCEDQFNSPMIQISTDPARGRVTTVTGQLGDSYESIEILEMFPDTDKDGVFDHADKCKDEPGLKQFDGCPDPDPDRDGVMTVDDLCPKERGPKTAQGCPDKDRDTIADIRDKCASEPGLKEFDGCPSDVDHDGIPDKRDRCRNEPGLLAFKGCPDPDPDRDKLVGKRDRCPNEPGPARLGGCPDTDGDGIADRDDLCSAIAGLPAFNGCPDPDPDRDGVNASDDQCPNVAGTLRGCPDRDGDSVADAADACPTVPGTAKGCPDRDGDQVADADDRCVDVRGDRGYQGCPIPDRDADGIADVDDRCPDQKGTIAHGGCTPPDGDGDGVPDASDNCPKEKGAAATHGCPPCGAQTQAGSDAAETHTIDLGATEGVFPFRFDTMSVPDRIVVTYSGSVLFDSGCVGTGRTMNLSFNGASTRVTVQVTPNCSGGTTGTQWTFTAGCPFTKEQLDAQAAAAREQAAATQREAACSKCSMTLSDCARDALTRVTMCNNQCASDPSVNSCLGACSRQYEADKKSCEAAGQACRSANKCG
jgi:hypothetical protein